MTRGSAEYQVHMACVRWLSVIAPEGCLWMHIPNGEKRDAITGAKLKRMGVRAGAADLLIGWRGQTLFVEIKAEDGRQTETQKEFEKAALAAGHAYVLVRNLQEFQLACVTFFGKGVRA